MQIVWAYINSGKSMAKLYLKYLYQWGEVYDKMVLVMSISAV